TVFSLDAGVAVDELRCDSKGLVIGFGLAAIAVIGKLLAGFSATGRGLRRSIIGVGMIPRGEVSLIFAQIGLTSGLLTQGLYSAVAVMVVLTGIATPSLLRALLPQHAPTELHGQCDLVMDAPMEDEAAT